MFVSKFVSNAGATSITQNNARPPHPQFKSIEVFDLGASNRLNGHLRVQVMNDRFQPQGSVADTTVTNQGFRNGNDVVTGIEQHLVEEENRYKNKLGPQDTLKAVVGFIPTTVKPGTPIDIPGLICKDGQSPKDLDFNRLPADIKHAGIPISNHFKLHLYHDTEGGSAYAAHALVTQPAFKPFFTPGSHATYMVIGGGLGAQELLHQRDHVKITDMNFPYLANKREQLDNTNVPKLIEHFATALGLPPDQINALKAQSNGRIVNDYQQAQKAIPGITPNAYQAAADKAIQKFLDGVATACCGRYLSGSTLFLLSGPSLHGIEKYLNKPLSPNFQTIVNSYNRQFPQGQQNRSNLEKILTMQIIKQFQSAIAQHPDTASAYKPFVLTTALTTPTNISGWSYLYKAGAQPQLDGSVTLPIASLQ